MTEDTKDLVVINEDDQWGTLAKEAGLKESAGLPDNNFYDSIPLNSIIHIHDRLQAAVSNTERLKTVYDILLEQSPIDGLTWYDVIVAPPHNHLIEALNEEVSKNHVGVALDLGAGTGKITKILEDNSDHTIAVDLLHKNLEFLREEHPSVDLVQANVTNIPLENESVDLIVCNGLIPFLTEEETFQLASEIDRVLKKGGSVVMVGPRITSEGERYAWQKEREKTPKGKMIQIIHDLIPPTKEDMKDARFKVGAFGYSLVKRYMKVKEGYRPQQYPYPQHQAVVTEFRKPKA